MYRLAPWLCLLDLRTGSGAYEDNLWSLFRLGLKYMPFLEGTLFKLQSKIKCCRSVVLYANPMRNGNFDRSPISPGVSWKPFVVLSFVSLSFRLIEHFNNMSQYRRLTLKIFVPIYPLYTTRRNISTLHNKPVNIISLVGMDIPYSFQKYVVVHSDFRTPYTNNMWVQYWVMPESVEIIEQARPSSPTFSDCEVKGIEWLRLLTLPIINSTPEAHTHTGRERVSGADDELMRHIIINHLESRHEIASF